MTEAHSGRCGNRGIRRIVGDTGALIVVPEFDENYLVRESRSPSRIMSPRPATSCRRGPQGNSG
jgi:hypothetical protein